eukprot:TRINITY_DN4951_c0_g1_i1.p1 TRINITY_DN4951_c0_g1~~TRINITY_DN4951_c0_g1_i1.p1  ORF type:complete len:378 (-),score=74.80 TRINITY_DN4951_c0_g1_i1:165-1247(-)
MRWRTAVLGLGVVLILSLVLYPRAPYLPDKWYTALGGADWTTRGQLLTVVPCRTKPKQGSGPQAGRGLPLRDLTAHAAALHPLSVVQSCPAPSGLWIALLSGGPAVAYRRFQYHLASKACYARSQGHSFLLDHTTRIAPEEAHLPPHWVKHYILRKWLPYFDWIFWVDLDATLFRMDVPLEGFLSMAPHAHLFLPRDAMENYVFSNDAFLLKNSPWGRAFLERWWAHRLSCGAWDDQGPMWTAIAAADGEEKTTACSPFCSGSRPHTRLYECVDRRFQRIIKDPKAPIYFPPLDFEKGLPGLCLNGFWNNHRKYPALQARMPWCLHHKRPERWPSATLRRTVNWNAFDCPLDHNTTTAAR